MANAQWTEPSVDELIIRGGWLFDGISDTRRQNSGIVIRDGTILEVDADLKDAVLSAATVIDLTESDTILPGMIDLHAHEQVATSPQASSVCPAAEFA